MREADAEHGHSRNTRCARGGRGRTALPPGLDRRQRAERPAACRHRRADGVAGASEQLLDDDGLGSEPHCDLVAVEPADLAQRERGALDRGQVDERLGETRLGGEGRILIGGSGSKEPVETSRSGHGCRLLTRNVPLVVQRRTLVSGAGSGIGRAIAERLERDGDAVLAVDLRPDAAGPGEAFEADLATPAGNRAAVDTAIERLGGLDVVIASAGFQHVAPVAEFPEERWDALLAVLLTSPFLLARYAWEALRESGDGRFLAVASVHGLVASPYKAGYVAAKHGLVGLVKVLALEGAEHGISATALCPGYVRTPIVEAQIEAQSQATGVPPERVVEDVLLAPQAVKRMLEPEEVAETAAFLLGPGGRAFTGAPVVMDLGWTAR